MYAVMLALSGLGVHQPTGAMAVTNVSSSRAEKRLNHNPMAKPMSLICRSLSAM